MIAFIGDERNIRGVEPISKVLPVALSTYHALAAKRLGLLCEALPSRRVVGASFLNLIRSQVVISEEICT